jgi:hypothetical protein
MAAPLAELTHDHLHAVTGGVWLSRFRATNFAKIGGWVLGNENVYKTIGQWEARFRMTDQKLQISTRFGEDGTPTRWKTIGRAPTE